MASHQPQTSSSIEEQNITICQICEDETKPQWKCLECGLMCQRCRDIIHPNFLLAGDHVIINYEENSAKEIPEPKPDLTRIKCNLHKGQYHCLYCKTCQELVCPDCIAQTHQSHDLDNIQEEYKYRLEKMEKRQKSVEKDMKTLKKSEEFLKEQTKTRQSHYDKVRQEIIEHEKVLVDTVKKHTGYLLKELDREWKAFSESVDKKKDVIEDKLKKSQEQHQGICHLLQPSKVIDVFSGALYHSLFISIDARFSLESLSSNIVPHFVKGNINKLFKILLEITGRLKYIYTRYANDLQVEQKIETDVKYISSLNVCSDGCLWISDSVSKVIQKGETKRDDFHMSVKTNLKKSVLSAALLHSGDLLLCVEGSSNLKLIPSGSSGIQNSVFTVQSLQPVCVHVTHDDKVIVIVKIGEKGGIMMMDQKGKQLKHLRHPNSVLDIAAYYLWKSTFNNDETPFNVTSNMASTIAVLVSTTALPYYSRVVILNKDMEYRKTWKYNSDSMDNLDRIMRVFRPRDIITSPSDNFVVPDPHNHIIHVLNSEGEFITFFDTFKLGILLPISLSFSTTGHLYIGCGTYQNSEEKAKIFEVTGFFH